MIERRRRQSAVVCNHNFEGGEDDAMQRGRRSQSCLSYGRARI